MTKADQNKPRGPAKVPHKPTPEPTQQVDDNQDDVGRDVNRPAEPSTNEVRPERLSKTPRP